MVRYRRCDVKLNMQFKFIVFSCISMNHHFPLSLTFCLSDRLTDSLKDVKSSGFYSMLHVYHTLTFSVNHTESICMLIYR